MVCHWKRSIGSLTTCAMNDTGGHHYGEYISRNQMGKSAHLAYQAGQINCCKKSCAQYWTHTMSHSLAYAPTDSALSEDVTPHYAKSKNGTEQHGSSKETSRDVLTTLTMQYCCQSSERKSTITGLSG